MTITHIPAPGISMLPFPNDGWKRDLPIWVLELLDKSLEWTPDWRVRYLSVSKEDDGSYKVLIEDFSRPYLFWVLLKRQEAEWMFYLRRFRK